MPRHDPFDDPGFTWISFARGVLYFSISAT
jgi:hypothetical protein